MRQLEWNTNHCMKYKSYRSLIDILLFHIPSKYFSSSIHHASKREVTFKVEILESHGSLQANTFNRFIECSGERRRNSKMSPPPPCSLGCYMRLSGDVRAGGNISREVEPVWVRLRSTCGGSSRSIYRLPSCITTMSTSWISAFNCFG